jgi:lipopolysaccharide export system protein LptC
VTLQPHVSELPALDVTLGFDRSRPPPRGWGPRLRDLLATYLPLLLMAMLALASWSLVKNLPAPLKPRESAPLRTEPDYMMSGFTTERFAPDGRLKLRLKGAQMRHFPHTDRIEVEQPELEAWAVDGTVTRARAARGLTNGDGSEVQLIGRAEVEQRDRQGQALWLRSEFLHLYTVTERVVTDQPVRVQRGGQLLDAGGMSYDHVQGLLQLKGRSRLVLPPTPRKE